MRLSAEGTYQMTWSEHAGCVLICTGICACAGWLFYDQALLLFLSIPVYAAFHGRIRQIQERKYQRQMRLDFKDTMLSVYSSLSAGTTLEESMKRAFEDMKRSLKPDSRMVLELELVCRKMERNIPVAQCLEDMAARCRNKDIENFARVLILAKKQGGNMAALVHDSVENIQRRIEISYEIEGILGAKRSEFFFMCVIPAGVIFYMRIFSSEFMDVLYRNATGIIVMSLCFGVYIGSICLGIRILRIDNE